MIQVPCTEREFGLTDDHDCEVETFADRLAVHLVWQVCNCGFGKWGAKAG